MFCRMDIGDHMDISTGEEAAFFTALNHGESHPVGVLKIAHDQLEFLHHVFVQQIHRVIGNIERDRRDTSMVDCDLKILEIACVHDSTSTTIATP